MDLEDFDDVGPSEPKRPRVGRQSRDILDAIERDTQCEARQRNLRAALLRLGELRAYQEISFSMIFKNQSLSVAGMLTADPAGSVQILLET